MRYVLPLAFSLLAACSDYTITGKVVTTTEETPSPTDESSDPTETTDGDEPEASDVDGDGYAVEDGDCDDSNAMVNPDGIEVCNGIDDDCDGNADSDAINRITIYFDADGDGHAFDYDTATSTTCMTEELPPGYYTAADDCDDTNPNVHPGAEEVCDWIPDNNCDGILDTGEIDGVYDSNGDGDYDDDGDAYETNGPDGYTWCYQYYDQVDADRDGYCSSGMDLNGDGDCIDSGDIIFPSDQDCPEEYYDCDVVDPNVYPGHGC